MASPRKSNKPAAAPSPAKTVAAAIAPSSLPTPAIVERSEVKGSTPKPVTATPRVISHDQIAKRAYEIYASRGYAAGDQNADWLEAERQLKAGL
ncbi:MAG TPA: DUF2934 domain-containing protein [Phycisphaerae bacterium]|nr:DUF2934 domain-containing protein [Phycisphaerae bacterium]